MELFSSGENFLFNIFQSVLRNVLRNIKFNSNLEEYVMEKLDRGDEKTKKIINTQLLSELTRVVPSLMGPEYASSILYLIDGKSDEDKILILNSFVEKRDGCWWISDPSTVIDYLNDVKREMDDPQWKKKEEESREKHKERKRKILSKMSEHKFGTSLCRFFSKEINEGDFWSPKSNRMAIISDFEIKLNSDDSEKIDMVRHYLEDEMERYRKKYFFVDKIIPRIALTSLILIFIFMLVATLSSNDIKKIGLLKERVLTVMKNLAPAPVIIPSKLSQKPFSVEGVDIHDILNSVNEKWEGAEVYVYAEHRTSGVRRVFILTCREKGIVSKFRDNLSLDTLVALSNFDKAIKGHIVTWTGRDYQEYYLESVSDIAVVRERGNSLDEMWRADVETGLD